MTKERETEGIFCFRLALQILELTTFKDNFNWGSDSIKKLFEQENLLIRAF